MKSLYTRGERIFLWCLLTPLVLADLALWAALAVIGYCCWFLRT